MKQLIKNIFNFPIGVLVVLTQSFMIVVPQYFSSNPEYFRIIILVLLAMQLLVYSDPGMRNRLFDTSLRNAVPKFATFFLVTYFFVSILAYFIKGSFLNPATVSFGILMIDSFVVSVTEESFFRDWLVKYLRPRYANIVFALFHTAVVAGNLISLLTLYLLGALWTLIKNKYSASTSVANMGSHAGYDTASRQFQNLLYQAPVGLT